MGPVSVIVRDFGPGDCDRVQKIWMRAGSDCAGKMNSTGVLIPSALCFPDRLQGIFVVSQSNKLGMSQVVRPGPLQELDPCDHLRARPNTFLHFLGS